MTIELLNVDEINEVFWRSRPGEIDALGYDPAGWVRVGVPDGMSSSEFDRRVLTQAMLQTTAVRGQDYRFWGSRNSNRFVYNIITGAGGKVPAAASRGFTVAPGICGGNGLLRGVCAP